MQKKPLSRDERNKHIRSIHNIEQVLAAFKEFKLSKEEAREAWKLYMESKQ